MREPDREVNGVTIPGRPIRRPFALQACERRAYQEAKRLYVNDVPVESGAPMEDILPQTEKFANRLVNSMRKQE